MPHKFRQNPSKWKLKSFQSGIEGLMMSYILSGVLLSPTATVFWLFFSPKPKLTFFPQNCLRGKEVPSTCKGLSKASYIHSLAL